MNVRAVVPCHVNAPDPALLAAVGAAVDGVLVVDDGLPADEVARLDGTDVLRLGGNHGKGTAVARGAERAVAEGADAVLVFDGDGQHPAAAIPAFLAAARHGGARRRRPLRRPARHPARRAAARTSPRPPR